MKYDLQESITTIVERTFGKNHVLITETDRITGPDSYVQVVYELARIAGSKMNLLEVKANEKNGSYYLTVSNNERSWSFALDAEEWIDEQGLINGMNLVLEELPSDYRFFGFYDSKNFTSQVGFFFADEDAGLEILDEVAARNKAGVRDQIIYEPNIDHEDSEFSGQYDDYDEDDFIKEFEEN